MRANDRLKGMTTARIGDATRAQVAVAWSDLLDQLAAGELMAPVYLKHGLTRDSVRCWRAENPEREKEWDAAREQSADAYAERALEVAYNGGSNPAHARVMVDTLKWAAAKRNPRAYSDRVDHNVTVKTIDLTRIIEAANARLAAAHAGRIIEHEVPKLEDLL